MTTASIVSEGSNDEKSPVAIPCIGYEEMSEDWELVHDLLGGTKAMQEAGQKWLPIEAAESTTTYDARLTRSILYNGFRDTVNKLKNRPFTKPIQVFELPDEISYLELDVDGNNKTLETFAKEVLENLIKYGIAHIFVAHSALPKDEETGEEMTDLTMQQERDLGVRVFLINMSPADLIGWQSSKEGNKTELIQIRQQETVVEPVGDYGDEEIHYVNVFNKDTWERHRQNPEEGKENEYILEEQGTSSLGYIPLVTIYAHRKGFMTAEPPLMDLAWLNLAHWQSYSDQRHILRFSRFGLLFGKGMPDSVVEKGTIELGPTKCVLVGEGAEHVDLKYVEHSGKSIEAGRKDLEDLEQKMRVLGNQPLMKELPNTATAEKLDENRTVSQLQAWVRALEKGINQALKIACKWREVQHSEDMGVEIYSDFEANILGGTDKDLLLKMRQSGEITRERFLIEMQRRAVIAEDVDTDEEAKAAAKEENNDLENFLPDMEDEESEEELESEE